MKTAPVIGLAMALSAQAITDATTPSKYLYLTEKAYYVNCTEIIVYRE